jgi:isoquinoline 1-oxidoreductase beta subunit
VVADGYWPAKQGRDALTLQWDTAAVEKVDSERQLAQYRELASRPGPRHFDADMAPLATAPRRLEAEFVFPYLAHAAMEPLNCTVALTEGRAELWTGSQCPGLDGAAAARVLGIKPEQVAVHVQMAGGGFGRRFASSNDFVIEACEIAKAARAAGLSAPVRTLWSREDDMRGGYYRPMHLHRARIGFDERGQVLAWDHVIVGQSITTGSVFEQFQVKNGIDATAAEGMRDPYPLPMRLTVHHPKLNVPVLWWRSVGSTHTAFVMETLVDEIARATKQDPVAYRMRLLGGKHPRPSCRTATGGGQERLRQDAPARRPRLGRGGARVLRIRGCLRGGSLGTGRSSRAPPGHGWRALQPGGEPADRGSAGPGRGRDGPVDVPAWRGHHAEGW